MICPGWSDYIAIRDLVQETLGGTLNRLGFNLTPEVEPKTSKIPTKNSAIILHTLTPQSGITSEIDNCDLDMLYIYLDVTSQAIYGYSLSYTQQSGTTFHSILMFSSLDFRCSTAIYPLSSSPDFQLPLKVDCL